VALTKNRKGSIMKLSDVMLRALELYGRIATDGIPADAPVAYPTTGTLAALVTRGLLYPAVNKWNHTLTEDGWAVLAERTSYNPDVARVFNIGDAHTMAIEENRARSETVKWHVGHNDATYSPDPEHITCHDDPAYARDALAAEIAQFAEYIGETCGHTVSTQDCVWCVRWDAARAVVDTLSDDFDMGEGVSFQLDDGRRLPVVYWAWPYTMDHAANGCNQD
jgi:hypothetical protein